MLPFRAATAMEVAAFLLGLGVICSRARIVRFLTKNRPMQSIEKTASRRSRIILLISGIVRVLTKNRFRPVNG